MQRSNLADRECHFMKFPAVFLVTSSSHDDRKIGLKVNPRSCWITFRPSLVTLLTLTLLSGCTHSPDTPAEKVAPAPAPSVTESADASQTKAPQPSQTPRVLQDLEKRIRPDVPPPPPPDDEKGRAEASAEVSRWVEKIAAHDAAGAKAFLVTEKDLEAVVTPGIKKILSSSLISKNRKDLEGVLEEAKGKEVRLSKWTAGDITRGQPGSFYRKPMTALKGELDLTNGDLPTHLDLDLLLIDGRWKLFKLSRPE
jgi:hypothetical protein